MQKNLRHFLLLSILGSALVFQGCATIFGGRTSSFVFDVGSNPPAQLYLDDELIGTAPGKIKLEKAAVQHGSKLEIKAEGYETQEYLIIRKMNALYTIGDIAFGAIWLGVDYATGDIYRPSPRRFTYVLQESNTPKP